MTEVYIEWHCRGEIISNGNLSSVPRRGDCVFGTERAYRVKEVTWCPCENRPRVLVSLIPLQRSVSIFVERNRLREALSGLVEAVRDTELTADQWRDGAFDKRLPAAYRALERAPDEPSARLCPNADCALEDGHDGPCDAEPEEHYDCPMHGLQDGPDCPRC